MCGSFQRLPRLRRLPWLHVVGLLMGATGTAGGRGGGGLGGGEIVKVFGLQENIWAPPRHDVFVRYNLSLKATREAMGGARQVTVCYRLRPVALTSMEPHVSLATSDSTPDSLVIYRRGERNGFHYNTKAQYGFPNFTTSFVLRQWIHYCHVFSSGQYRAYVDGKERARGPIDNPVIPMPLNGSLVLGQEQDVLGGGFDRLQIFRGKIAQVNIWSKILSKQEITLLAQCRSSAAGNVFSSDRETVETFEASVDLVPLEALCKNSDEYVILPEMRKLSESIRMCHRMGCDIYGPLTRAGNEQLHEESLTFTVTCANNYHLWIGLTDEGEEGVWRRFSDSKIVRDLAFAPNYPNGGSGENCVFMSRIKGLWQDTSCPREWFACVPCTRDPTRTLRLRGLCERQETETVYEVLGYRDGKPYFHGFYGNMIYRSQDEDWLILDTRTNMTLASLTVDSPDDYPIGHKSWTLEASVCNQRKGTTVDLNLSVCDDTDFTCSNGDCISRERRCDSVDDCTDRSDEANCNFMKIPKGYRNQRPPEGEIPGKPLEIAATVTILRFVEISDVKGMTRMEIELTVSWKDVRIKYLNLRDAMEWNKLSPEENSLIWKPVLEFPNVYDGKVRRLKKALFLSKAGKPIQPDFNDAKMDVVYEGTAARLVMQQHYSGSFACAFNVFRYPFDSQRCTVLVQLSSVRQEVVTFSGRQANISFLEDTTLPSYVVSRHRVTVTHRGNWNTRHSVLQVEFELTRRWTVIVLALYFPTGLLMIIGYATLYVKVAQLQVRLTVSLTTLLVLYTLFNNTSDALPPTAYMKMIDIWFFCCILLLFFIIITHVFIEHVENTRAIRVVQPAAGKTVWGGTSPERVLSVMRTAIVPGVVVTFSLVYWTLMFGS